MKRTFKVTTKFNSKSEAVVKCIENNFDIEKMNEDGVYEMTYSSNCNATSSEESVVKGFKKYLNFFEAFKRNYEIVNIEEVK